MTVTSTDNYALKGGRPTTARGKLLCDGSSQPENLGGMMNLLGSKTVGYLLSNPGRHQHIRAPFAGRVVER